MADFKRLLKYICSRTALQTNTYLSQTTLGFCHSRSYPARYWQPLKSVREVFGYFNFIYRETIVRSHSLPQCPGCAFFGDIPHQIRGVIVVPLPWDAHLDSKQQLMGPVSRKRKQTLLVSPASRTQNSQFSPLLPSLIFLCGKQNISSSLVAS